MEIYHFSPWDIFPYFILLLLAFGISSSKTSYANKTKYLFGLMLIFSCIRYGVGYDYLQYKNIIESGRVDYTFERFMPLAQSLVVAARQTHYQLFFIVTSFLILTPIYYVIRRESDDPVLSSMIYLLHPLLFLEGLGPVRNAVGFSLVFLAGYLLTQRKVFFSLLCVAIAYGFHPSSLVGLLIYPMYYFSIKRNFHIILYLLSFVISTSLPYLLSSVLGNSSYMMAFEHYVEEMDTSGGGTLTWIINAINIIFLINWKKIAKCGKNSHKYLEFVNYGTFIWNAFLPLSFTFAFRLSSYFMIFTLLLYPRLTQVFLRKYKIRRLILIFFTLFFVSSFMINIKDHIKNKSDMANLPYQVVFYHSDYSNIERWR